MNREKRICPRITSRLLVHYSHYRKMSKQRSSTTVIFARGEKAFARSLDISCSGMLLESNKQYRKDTYLDLRISMGEEIVKATAKIVHIQKLENDKYGLGIKFLQMSEEHRDCLYDYILSKLEGYAPAPA